ncbi:MAG: phosphoribosylglycinamide formyltransferase [Gammaproteobacteria bacterium]|nr:phosphoribosylglycinamide formyltransferase [Gammaproteobacteria bacterium]
MKLGLLASGRGSNLQAVIDACADGHIDAEPCVVVCNNRDAEALARAATAGIAAVHLSSRTHPAPAALDAAIRDTLASHGVDLVVLAGYMKRLGPLTLERFRGRIVNIHPALLPQFGGQGMYGMRVHEAVLAAGACESGATVHLVDAEYDRGAILAQSRVPVHARDTAPTLAARVLDAEHTLLVDTLARIARGALHLPGLSTPLR